MASGIRGHNCTTDENPSPPPDANLAQILRLLLEDRNNSRAERKASIAALQQIAQAAINNNKQTIRNPAPSCGIFRTPTHLFSPRASSLLMRKTGSAPLRTTCWLPVWIMGEKVTLATNFLAGPAHAWWETTKAMIPAD